MNPLRILLFNVVAWCLVFWALPVMASESSLLEGLTDGPERLTSESRMRSVCRRFNTLNSHIRDTTIDSRSARIELQRTLAEVREEYRRSAARAYPSSAWVFPLAGFDARAVGGGKLHGYSARGYDFYRGNRHGGHPSYDIFIRDRNQDGLDDRTLQPVKVVSMTGGVVVALEGEWEPGSRLRGGKYVWVYDPAHDLLVYYAHNADLLIKLGEVVRPGDVLAVVGRSGFNAAKRRSPTHLHLTVLKVQDGNVIPVKVFQALQRARSSDGRPPET